MLNLIQIYETTLSNFKYSQKKSSKNDGRIWKVRERGQKLVDKVLAKNPRGVANPLHECMHFTISSIKVFRTTFSSKWSY